MKNRGYVEKVRVADPCTQDWNEMVGNDQVRFCTHCAKDVNDLSAMTRKEARKLIRRSAGNLCVRYVEHPETRAPLYSEDLIQITRRAPRIVAGLIGASLSLATLTYAQGGARKISPEPPTNQQVEQAEQAGGEEEKKQTGDESAAKVGRIVGTVVDRSGAAIMGATVRLREYDGETIATTTTDEIGTYKFENLELARYEVEADAPMFRSTTFELRLRDATEKEANFELGEKKPVAIASGAVGVTRVRYVGPIIRAVEDEDLELVRKLLVDGEDVNHLEDDDTTPIFIAVARGNLDLVKLLLEFGAKLNVKDDEGVTPLMKVDDDATLELVELLLNEKAEVDAKDEEGYTALHHAAEDASPDVLQALIKAGAKIDAKNEDGETPLMIAADANNLENVRFLLNAGADVNIRDKEGDNAWDHASELEIEELLVAHGVVLDPEDEIGRKFLEPEDQEP